MTVARAPASSKPPLWRNLRVLRVAFQVAFLVAVVGLIAYLHATLTANLRRIGLGNSFGFLDEAAGFAIIGADFSPSESILAAIVVGIRNTALVAIVGIVLATVLGMLVGVARLSTNWLVRRAAGAYVETLRNVPVLVIILFWYLGVLAGMPPPDEAIELGGLATVSIRGITLPWLGEGFDLTPEYGALLIGLVIYTASHIAEVVRGSILAVPRGQTEAADALALSGAQRLRLVILPQAVRIMIPPLANQYLNLTKNSALGSAIAFPEVTRVMRIAIGQQAPAPQSIAILMLIYLAFSLSISLLTNLVNWRAGLKGGR